MVPIGSDALRVGVLAFQGDFREHVSVLTHLGCHAIPVRRPQELAAVNGLVIPGGESTVMDKLCREFGMRDPIREAINGGLPVYGTCAGLIMLAQKLIDGIEGQQTLEILDILVRRNAFGSQVLSFETDLLFPVVGDAPVHAVFIRAPIVESVGSSVRVLATLPDGRVVAVEQNNVLGTAFHPEVSGDYRIHEYFLQKIMSR